MTSIGRRRDDARVLAALPDALERLASGLRAGEAISTGLELWASGEGPLADDARSVVSRAEAGETVERALAAWPERRSLPEIRVASAALQVAVRVGGRSAAALEGLACAFRDAADARAEVRAQSAQARLSALVIGMAPAGAVGLTLVVDRRVPRTLVGTAPGRACLLVGLGLMAAAFGWMARILRPAG